MKEIIDENNRLRIQQMGNMPASEMTKRELMSLSILEGLLSKSDCTGNEDFFVGKAISLADLLIEKLNSNL